MTKLYRKRLHKWEAVCGVCCFIAGILAPVLGMVFLALEWVAGVTLHTWLYGVGTTLLIIGIPLILFAGFCLDWAEAGQKADSPGRNQRSQFKLIQASALTTLLASLLRQR